MSSSSAVVSSTPANWQTKQQPPPPTMWQPLPVGIVFFVVWALKLLVAGRRTGGAGAPGSPRPAGLYVDMHID
ncbi:hypothetical protein BDZ88DRAFT_450327 [Geranomyces variabilis]|nr:hypothetical protein BDZ88DRAFT_450327 [Geranomyces variabilis]KAJ3136694.1 hypothetical protein HDU90_003071 [Geranomyces variabilis]